MLCCWTRGVDSEGILDFQHDIDGSGGEFLFMPGGGSLHPPSPETLDQKMHYVHQDGKQVFKYAVRRMSEIACQLLERNGYSHQDVTLVVPHQANLRIIRAMQDRLGLDDSKVAGEYRSIRKYDRRHDSSGSVRRGEPRTAQEGRSRRAGCGGGGLYDGRGIDALGVLEERDSRGPVFVSIIECQLARGKQERSRPPNH